MINLQRYDAILFDLDGTLVDTVYGIAATLNQLLREYDKPAQAVSNIRNVVSRGSRFFTQQFFDIAFDSEAGQLLLKQFMAAYPALAKQNDTPFVGCNALLDYLEAAGMPWGIVTNKLHCHSAPLIQQLAWQERCACLVSGDTAAKAKPAPEPLEYACDKLNVKPERCLFIGDDLNDIAAGKAANMATAVALHGYINSSIDPYEWQADYYHHDLWHLRQWLALPLQE